MKLPAHICARIQILLRSITQRLVLQLDLLKEAIDLFELFVAGIFVAIDFLLH
jgi:hypothetical protein